ncbi:MAG: peptidoglycan editing factor PgeF [Pseudomonadota bacterium]
MSTDWLVPAWPMALGDKIGAISSTRAGGVSDAPFDSFNLGDHVGDAPAAVTENRARFATQLHGSRPLWLTQVHGADVVEAADWKAGVKADAIVVRTPGQAGVIMTADCVPVLFASLDGSVVAAAHAGWRGLAAGVLANTVSAMGVAREAIAAWIGPAIGQAAFEVGDEVRAAFVEMNANSAVFFERNARGRWQADLVGLTMRALGAAGLTRITLAHRCTASDARAFFSHRRSAPCGRMATAIWIRPGA